MSRCNSVMRLRTRSVLVLCVLVVSSYLPAFVEEEVDDALVDRKVLEDVGGVLASNERFGAGVSAS